MNNRVGVDTQETESRTQSNFDTSSNNCCDSAHCAQPIESLVSNVMSMIGGTDLQNNTVDSRDLQKYKAKIPILLLYLTAFIVSFAGLFSYSYTTEMSTKYLSPKDPKAPDSVNCESDAISVTDTYMIDTNGNWEGTEAFQPGSLAYEVKFQNFQGSYDDWKDIADEFEKDINRVRDTSNNMRKGQGDMAYDLLIPASYSFYKKMPMGSVQIYLRADASYLFGSGSLSDKGGGSMTGYMKQKNSPETSRLSAVAPGEIEVSYDIDKGGILTFEIPTFKSIIPNDLPDIDDDYDDDGDDGGDDGGDDDYDWRNNDDADRSSGNFPASSFIASMSKSFKFGKEMNKLTNLVNDDMGNQRIPKFDINYDMRSAGTAVAINNGLASIDSLQPLDTIDFSDMDADKFYKKYIKEQPSQFMDSNIGKYIDPYYPDMDPIVCLSARFLQSIIDAFVPSLDDANQEFFGKYVDNLKEELREKVQRHVCFVIGEATMQDSRANNGKRRLVDFLAFPTMNQVGSWSDTSYLVGNEGDDDDIFIDDQDVSNNHRGDVKDECWFPAYGRYDGLQPGHDANPETIGKYIYSSYYYYRKRNDVQISFLNMKTNSQQILEYLTTAKLMHEMLSSYPTMEDRFYALYTENAATSMLTLLTGSVLEYRGNDKFYNYLYGKWITQNNLTRNQQVDSDPLYIQYGKHNSGLEYGLIEGRYRTVADIKAREDLFLTGGSNYNFNDDYQYAVIRYFAISYSGYKYSQTSGPYEACKSNQWDDGSIVRRRFTVTSKISQQSTNGDIIIRILDSSTGLEISNSGSKSEVILRDSDFLSDCMNVTVKFDCKNTTTDSYCYGDVAIFPIHEPSSTAAPTSTPVVGFFDFVSNNTNFVLDLNGVSNSLNPINPGRGDPNLKGCPNIYSDIMIDMFDRLTMDEDSYLFTTSVVMSIDNYIYKDEKNFFMAENVKDIIYDKAIKKLPDPPVQLSQSYETCTKSSDSAIVNSLGVAFSNAKLISDVVLMLSLFIAVYTLNNYVIKSKAHKLISPENKSKLFRMTTSLAIQRMMKVDSKDYSNDQELKNIVHALHVYDDMSNEEENFDHIKTMLADLGVEMEPAPTDVSNTVSTSSTNSSWPVEPMQVFEGSKPSWLDNSAAKIAELEAALRNQDAVLRNQDAALKVQDKNMRELLQRISLIEISKDSYTTTSFP